MATEVYNGTFKSVRNGDDYYICITNDYTTSKPVSADRTYLLGVDGFTLSKHGDDQSFSGVKPQSVKFQFIAEGSNPETDLETILSDGDTEWFVIIWKNDAFYWWGYLDISTISKNRDYYPITYNLEAFDQLTKIGGVGVFDFTPTGFTAPRNTAFGFGWRKNNDPTSINSQTPQLGWQLDPSYNSGFTVNTTLLGFIYSLIFDANVYSTDLQTLNVVTWDTAQLGDTANASRYLEYVSLVDFHDFFFNDPLNYLTNGGSTGQQNRNWGVAELLDNICKVLRMRLFQRNGEYYLIQWEAYQGDPVNGYLYIHKYDNDQITSLPTASNVIMPTWSQTTTLSTTTDWKVSFAAPRTNPDILNGANYTYKRPFDKMRITIRKDQYNDESETFEKDLGYTIAANGPFSNFTSAAKNVNEFQCSFPYSWIGIFRAGAYQYNFFSYDGSAYAVHKLYSAYLDREAQYQNGRKAVFNGVLYGDFDFFKAFTLDGIVFLPTTEEFVAADDEHRITALEFAKNASGIGGTWKTTGDFIADPAGGISGTSSRTGPKTGAGLGGPVTL